MYTSGTTGLSVYSSLSRLSFLTTSIGNPKGVQLSNKNILAAVAGLMSVGVSLCDTDVYFRFFIFGLH